MRKLGIMTAILLLGTATVLFTGCQKPPDADVQASMQSIDAAKQGEAEKYAQGELGTAQATMDQARSEIEMQKAKWMPNYEKAKSLLSQAKAEADQAREAAIAGKERVKGEATAAIQEAKAMIEQTAGALKSAPRGKGSRADIEQFNSDLAGYQTSLAEADQMMAGEDYMGARDKANAVKEGTRSIQDQIVAVGGKIPPLPEMPAGGETM